MVRHLNSDTILNYFHGLANQIVQTFKKIWSTYIYFKIILGYLLVHFYILDMSFAYKSCVFLRLLISAKQCWVFYILLKPNESYLRYRSIIDWSMHHYSRMSPLATTHIMHCLLHGFTKLSLPVTMIATCGISCLCVLNFDICKRSCFSQ
jgi:hypothetical protein